MLASGAVSVRKPSSAADTAKRSTSVFVAKRAKVDRVRISAADASIPQLAASNASRSANEFANVPTVIVFHTRTSTADLIGIGGILADGSFLSASCFCKLSRAEH